MSEHEIVYKMFINTVNARRGKRISIYGAGEYTRFILSRLDDDILNGLMLCNNQKIGEPFEGLIIRDIREVLVDTVIIVARDMVIRLIYERIQDLTSAEIVNVRGENLREQFANQNIYNNDNPYWCFSKSDLKSAIDIHEVVSFDLFDTLIMRRIMRPHDELGFEIEKKFTVPRKDIKDCFYYALEQQKQVYILSDMYLSSSQLDELLNCNGISGYKEIIVSCEHGVSKEDGGLYDVLKSISKNKNILHIGDNWIADIENARAHGLDAFYIMNSNDMMLNSPMYKLFNSVNNIADSMILGEFASVALGSPFALVDGGKLNICDMDKMADLFFPIVRCLMSFICTELYGRSSDTIILLLSRDGYFIKCVYDLIVEHIGDNEHELLPKALYFPASREAVSEKYSDYHGNYKRYAEELGILSYRDIKVFDGATRGTTVAGLERIFGRTLELMCLATFNIDELFTKKRTRSLLGDFSFYNPKYYAVKYYELFEIALKPNEPQFLYINDNNEAVYKKVAIYDNGIKDFQDSLFRKFKELSISNSKWFLEPPRAEISDVIFGLIEPKFSKVSKSVVKAFAHESMSEGIPTGNWWERLMGNAE